MTMFYMAVNGSFWLMFKKWEFFLWDNDNGQHIECMLAVDVFIDLDVIFGLILWGFHLVRRNRQM